MNTERVSALLTDPYQLNMILRRGRTLDRRRVDFSGFLTQAGWLRRRD